MLVEIYGADLFVKGDDNSANLKFESWWKGKPDCYVKFCVEINQCVACTR